MQKITKQPATQKKKTRAAASPQRGARAADNAAAFKIAGQLAVALHDLLGPMCEVVVHDFADLEHSIIQIEGDVTYRAIGGAATDLILESVRTNATESDLYGYATSQPGGRIMKSSTVFLRDVKNHAIGALCINLDMTDFVAFRNRLDALVHTQDSERATTETLSDNLFETVQSAVEETIYESGRSLHTMSREDMIDLVVKLEQKGLFQVKRAVPIVADMLGLSRATVYNYLRRGREDRG
ncbi:MAG: PAS domain-containing protein [Chloroflexi bacterium]|nr:PAS domain-containing protein [Chloroflexota bacterium]